MARPLARYRSDFRARLLEERPRRVLDVGSGTGGLLRKLDSLGIEAHGLEADPGRFATLQESGYAVQQVEDEALPFDDDSFDLVVSEYTAHHFADLGQHLREARRVARRAVWLLDCWYDLTLASQRRMLRWDEWFKKIDRREGRVHNKVLTIDDFPAALPDVGIDRFEFRCTLLPTAVDVEWFDRESDEYRPRANASELEELAEIRSDLLAHGMTDDGAIIVRLDASEGA